MIAFAVNEVGTCPKKIERESIQTHNLLITRHVLYRCATTAAQII